MKIIDLRSDTITKPTQDMLDTIKIDKLGDDVSREDSLVNELELKAAKIFNKEAALFCTSGTQGNLLGLLSQTNPGDEIILEADSHIFYYEAGGLSRIAGVMPRLITGNNGIITSEQVAGKIRPTTDIHQPLSTLVSIEQTHNRGGGIVYPVEIIDDIGQLARENQMGFHMDGARVFNASIFLNKPVSRITQACSTVQFCLSKGLSAPVGSLLVGKEETINKARKFRKMLGGGMRQAGVIAGPGLYALENMVDRLIVDHQHATFIAKSLRSITDTWTIIEPQTNIIKVNIPKGNAVQVEHKLEDLKILCHAMDRFTIRFVTHRNLSKEEIDIFLQRVEDSIELKNLLQ